MVSMAMNANITEIQTLQNKIIRTALQSHRYARTKDIHQLAGILLFKDRIIFNQLRFINKNLTSEQPLFLPLMSSSHSTRATATNNLALATPNVISFRKSFCYNGLKSWNNLTNYLRSPQSFYSFNIKLKAMFQAILY